MRDLGGWYGARRSGNAGGVESRTIGGELTAMVATGMKADGGIVAPMQQLMHFAQDAA